jgi:hypothetical protein
MSQPPDSSLPFSIDEHPTSLFAGYVDGAATAAERDEVERHLESCASCRAEIDVARGALEALASLPVLEAPGLDPAALRSAAEAAGGAGGGDRPPVISIRERRRDRRPAVTAALGLAAAAAIAAVVVFAVGRSGGPGGGSTAAGTAAAKAPPGHELTQQDLRQLTDALAEAQGSASGPQTLAGAGGASAPASSPGSESGGEASTPTTTSSESAFAPANPVAIDPNAAGGVPCARRASGQDVTAQVVYAQGGSFAGKRVYVIGFVAPPIGGGQAHVTVVAVPVGECTIAFLARESVP